MKQFDLIGGRRMIDISVAAMSRVADGVVVVVPPSTLDEIDLPGAVVVAGGGTRSESVRCGLDALPPEASHVLVHDGARPLVSPRVVDGVIDALVGGAKGAVPVVPVTDSLRHRSGGNVDRSELVAVQTPQGFELRALLEAHASGLDATDDASLLDQVGIEIVHTAGDPTNIKVTVPNDLLIAEVLFHG